MRPRILLALVLVTLSVTGAGADGVATAVGMGHGITLPRLDDPPCDGNLLLTWDGTAENGYGWRYGGVVPPYYGAFAEGYDADGYVCGASFFFTEDEYYERSMDVYVWGSDGEDPPNPGAVLALVSEVNIDPPGHWPEVSQHDVGTGDTAVSGDFFVGYWGNWPGLATAWYVAADLDGPTQGLPRTNIAPGIGYPTGWQDVSVTWGATRALGIGAYVSEEPTPSRKAGWGTIKKMYK